MSSLTSLVGGGIKSIQQGTVTFIGGYTSGTASITSVDTAKSVVINGGASFTLGSETATPTARVVLTNATTVTATRTPVNEALDVGFTVIEYY